MKILWAFNLFNKNKQTACLTKKLTNKSFKESINYVAWIAKQKDWILTSYQPMKIQNLEVSVFKAHKETCLDQNPALFFLWENQFSKLGNFWKRWIKMKPKKNIWISHLISCRNKKFQLRTHKNKLLKKHIPIAWTIWIKVKVKQMSKQIKLTKRLLKSRKNKLKVMKHKISQNALLITRPDHKNLKGY